MLELLPTSPKLSHDNCKGCGIAHVANLVRGRKIGNPHAMNGFFYIIVVCVVCCDQLGRIEAKGWMTMHVRTEDCKEGCMDLDNQFPCATRVARGRNTISSSPPTLK